MFSSDLITYLVKGCRDLWVGHSEFSVDLHGKSNLQPDSAGAATRSNAPSTCGKATTNRWI